MYYYGHTGYFGWFGMALFWGLSIWLIIWLINNNKNKNHEVKRTPLDIAGERYAKGEISKKEYEDMKKELSDKR